MLIFKALYRGVSAFCSSLNGKECSHERISTHKHASFCPDCGYQVRMLWTIVRCRTCGTKRLPKHGLDGSIAPMYRYCQDCGAQDYRIIKKERIHAHEMAYALSTREVDYSEERKPTVHKEFSAKNYANNPFLRAFDVVEGEVMASRYVTL